MFSTPACWLLYIGIASYGKRNSVMSTRTNNRQICHLFYRRFHGNVLWMSVEEQDSLDMVAVGVWEPRLRAPGNYAWGQTTCDDVMLKLQLGSVKYLH